MNRPLPAGRRQPGPALAFGIIMAFAAVLSMAYYVNLMSAALLLVTILYYVFVYTVWLKRLTPQNVVIGGVSGALPPVVGWASVTGSIDFGALSLFLIIFLWTPPHSWALALYRRGDYEAAGVPMLPVAAGVQATKRQMTYYTVLLLPVTLIPVAIGLSGIVYAVIALIFALGFAFHSHRLWHAPDNVITQVSKSNPARGLFFFSIQYLFALFVALLADRLFFLPVF